MQVIEKKNEKKTWYYIINQNIINLSKNLPFLKFTIYLYWNLWLYHSLVEYLVK